jgi:hypothetical protein
LNRVPNDQLFSIIYLMRGDEEFVTQKLQQLSVLTEEFDPGSD